MNKNRHSEYDAMFFKDGYRLGEQAARDIEKEESLFESVEAMYDSVDGLIGSLLTLAGQQGVKVDCRKGCSWCCHQPVFANTYELRYLARHIRDSFTKEEQLQIFLRSEEKNSTAEEMSEKQVLSYKRPCPLLKDGACTAYQARPLACRIYLSMNVDTCIQFYQHPGSDESYPALLDFPLRAGRMMNEGFFAALKEHGYTPKEYRLEEGLVAFLNPEEEH